MLNVGAAVDLGSLNLYYLNGGDPKQFFNGDARLDGKVDFQDLGALATNYNHSGMAWAQGDFNGDGAVDFVDLGVLATNYNKSTPAKTGQSVPEPGTLSVLLLGGAACLRRRERW